MKDTTLYAVTRSMRSLGRDRLSNDSSHPLVIMIPKTMGASLVGRSVAFDEVHLSAGQTVLIPASCSADTALRAGPGTEAIVARLSG